MTIRFVTASSSSFLASQQRFHLADGKIPSHLSRRENAAAIRERSEWCLHQWRFVGKRGRWTRMRPSDVVRHPSASCVRMCVHRMVCMRVCKCVCGAGVHVCMYKIYACVYVSVYMCNNMCVCVYVCMCVCVYMCLCGCRILLLIRILLLRTFRQRVNRSFSETILKFSIKLMVWRVNGNFLENRNCEKLIVGEFCLSVLHSSSFFHLFLFLF